MRISTSAVLERAVSLEQMDLKHMIDTDRDYAFMWIEAIG
jgi:hypothetical protein